MASTFGLQKMFCAALSLLAVLAACSHGVKQPTSAREVPKDMGSIIDTTLELRGARGANVDNWAQASLYVTDWDREHNMPEMYATASYHGSGNPVPTLREVCSKELGPCGFVKEETNLKLTQIDNNYAQQKIKAAGIKSSEEQSSEGTFQEGDTWIYSSRQYEWANGPMWQVTLAIALVDFKPSAGSIKLRYKVL